MHAGSDVDDCIMGRVIEFGNSSVGLTLCSSLGGLSLSPQRAVN